jgi:hypothetical protein
MLVRGRTPQVVAAPDSEETWEWGHPDAGEATGRRS